MPTYKYIYDEREEYVWCKLMRSFASDCEDEESIYVWETWGDWIPGSPFIEQDPCMISGCYPWEIDDIIYDSGGKWRVTQVSTESWQLAQYNMYDCFWYEPAGNYRKFFHLDYIHTARATLLLLHGPITSLPVSLLMASSLLGALRIPGEEWGEFGIGLKEAEEEENN